MHNVITSLIKMLYLNFNLYIALQQSKLLKKKQKIQHRARELAYVVKQTKHVCKTFFKEQTKHPDKTSFKAHL